MLDSLLKDPEVCFIDCKEYLRRLSFLTWELRRPDRKTKIISDMCSLIHYSCDFPYATKDWMRNLFLENGGWAADHPFTMAVIECLDDWGSLVE
jgi:hypothetical protein